jgi:shikimate dehydrogenase
MYKRLGIHAELVKDECDGIPQITEHILNVPYELSAITMPYKEVCIDLVDTFDETAGKTGSVNTIINRNGKLYGYNTDVYGIEYALRNVELKNKNVLVMGSGGVARSIAYVLQQCGSNILIVNRTKEKAEELAQCFGGRVATWEETKSEDVDVIINTTPIGMYPDVDESPVPESSLQSHHIVFDIVYNPVETKLLQDAKKNGAKIISGLDMFVAQGLRQIELWKNINIDISKYSDEMKNFITL